VGEGRNDANNEPSGATHIGNFSQLSIYRAFHNVLVITNIYNKKTIGPTLMEFFTAIGKLKNIFF
jgi:hypothetical protein